MLLERNERARFQEILFPPLWLFYWRAIYLITSTCYKAFSQAQQTAVLETCNFTECEGSLLQVGPQNTVL